MSSKEVQLLKFSETAERLRVSKRSLTYMVARGDIKSIKFGAKTRRFDPADVAAFIDKCRVG